MILYENTYGYIKGSKGYIDEFVVYTKYRGKGYARKLAKHLPKHCKLLCQPMWGKGRNILNLAQLCEFYQSLGFIKTTDCNGLLIMKR